MISLRRLARLGAFAGGSLLVGLSLVGFVSPTPLPTISPAVPLPSPSIPTLQSLLGPSSGGQPATGGTPASRQAPSAVTPRSGSRSLAAPAQAQPLAGTPLAASAARAQRLAAGPEDLRDARPAVGLPRTGAGTGPPDGPSPLAPGVLAGALLALFFCGLRLRAPQLGARRYRVRVGYGAAGAPDGAAAAAVRCLLVSELPDGIRLRAHGTEFLVDAPMLQRAVLGTRLNEVASRARRVGLSLEWAPVSGSAHEADREPVVALRAYRLQGG